jgi:hypothetical protein
MTKKTKAVAVAACLTFTAVIGSVAVSAAASGAQDGTPNPFETFIATVTASPTASSSPSATASESLTPTHGDATIEDVESNGPPIGGKISEEDPDLSEGYVDPNTLYMPTVELTGTIDGQTFNGTVHIDATASNVPLEQFIITFGGTVLLADGTTRGVAISPLEYRQLGIEGRTVSTNVTYDLSDFINTWSSPGVEIGGVAVDSMSTAITVKLHPSYLDPVHDLSGYDAASSPLKLTFTR